MAEEEQNRLIMASTMVQLIGVIGILSCFAVVSTQAQLQTGFYDHSCPKAEKLIMQFVHEHIPNAPSLAAALLRMHFHDCFVRVCTVKSNLHCTLIMYVYIYFTICIFFLNLGL